MNGEFDFIRTLREIHGQDDEQLMGIGDDCALLTVGGETLALTIDAMVEDVHFKRAWTDPHSLGRKAAAISLSDLAAMGTAPLCLLVTAALPSDLSQEYALALSRGIAEQAEQAGARVAGGDTTSTPGPIVLDVMALGRVPRGGRALLRSGARPDDLVVLTGTTGLAAAGLASLSGELALPTSLRDETLQRLHTPQPRVAEGLALSRAEGVHALIDVSDGLVQDLGHLCQASGLDALVDPDALPTSSVMEHLKKNSEIDTARFMLSGGEDYELLAAIDPDLFQDLARQVKALTGTPLTAIGQFKNPLADPTVRNKDAQPLHYPGWNHFIPT